MYSLLNIKKIISFHHSDDSIIYSAVLNASLILRPSIFTVRDVSNRPLWSPISRPFRFFMKKCKFSRARQKMHELESDELESNL